MMATEPVIGWDLGGAHLKAARLEAPGAVERVVQVPCPLWQGLHHLDAAFRQVLPVLGLARLHAATMTGEMVDLFPDRGAGVSRLVTALQQRLPPPDRAVWFYAGADGFVDAARAVAVAPRVASANWQASAALVAACLPAALFVDIGSTTTDLAVVQGGRVHARGRGDAERLSAGELVYTGVVRTPVMALADRVPFGESGCPWCPSCSRRRPTSIGSRDSCRRRRTSIRRRTAERRASPAARGGWRA